MYFTLNIWTMYKIYRKLFNRFRIRAVNCMNERVHEAKIYTPWYILGGGDHYKNYYPTEAEMYVS
jgi:hypothetical protein